MKEQIKLSFVVPESLQQELRENMVREGYGLRGKSRWVSEAIVDLLAMPQFIDYVSYNDELKGFEKVETVVIDKSIKKSLDLAVVDIRKCHPTIEGVQSRIIRTAIIQRLLRS